VQAHLVDTAEDVVAGGPAEGVDHLAEDERHERLRDAVGHRRHRADQHQQHVRAVGVPEQPGEGHLLPGILLLFLLFVHLLGVHCSQYGACYSVRVVSTSPLCFAALALARVFMGWLVARGGVGSGNLWKKEPSVANLSTEMEKMVNGK
jgi:hypothetical protein